MQHRSCCALSELLPTEAAVWACVARDEIDDVCGLLAPADRTRLHAFAAEFERRLATVAADWAVSVPCGACAHTTLARGAHGGASLGVGKCKAKRAGKAKAKAKAKRRAAALLAAKPNPAPGFDTGADADLDPVLRVKCELAALLSCSSARKRDERLERVCRPLLGGMRWE